MCQTSRLTLAFVLPPLHELLDLWKAPVSVQRKREKAPAPVSMQRKREEGIHVQQAEGEGERRSERRREYVNQFQETVETHTL